MKRAGNFKPATARAERRALPWGSLSRLSAREERRATSGRGRLVLGSLFRDFSQGGVSLKDLRSVKPSGPLRLLDARAAWDLAAKTWPL